VTYACYQLIKCTAAVPGRKIMNSMELLKIFLGLTLVCIITDFDQQASAAQAARTIEGSRDASRSDNEQRTDIMCSMQGLTKTG
jgi:hypothetical protein